MNSEERQRAEENRRKAMAKKQERELANRQATTTTTTTMMAFANNSTNKPQQPVIPNNLNNYNPASNNTNMNRNINYSTNQNRPIIRNPSQPINQLRSQGPAKNLPPVKKIIGTCRMIDRYRFVVDMPFHKEAVAMFKTINGSLYDPVSKIWNFPIQEHATLNQKALALSPYAGIGALPSFVLRIFQNAKPKLEIPDVNLEEKCDPVIVKALLPFQRQGVCYAIARKGRVLIADDMGLGKTIQGLAIANYYSQDWPLLIICPSSMKYSWMEAIEQWLPSTSLGSVSVVEGQQDYIYMSKVIIMSYDMLCKRFEEPPVKECGVIILDESHHLKNFKTQRTKAASILVNSCKRAILLSGTPALSRPLELFTQVTMLDKNIFSYEDFGIRYCAGKKVHRFGKDVLDCAGSSNMGELQLVLEEKVMIRRLKTQVLKQLPEKRRQVVYLDSSLIKKASKELKQTETDFSKDINNRSKLMLYYHQTGKAKVDAVIEYINELLESDTKFLCFAHHGEVLDSIERALDGKNVKYIRIDGRTDPEDRKLACDAFQSSDTYRVALLSIKAANTGLTLTAASLVVFAELYWNPGDLTQAEDRVHRIGQEDCVMVKYLVAKGTADDHIWSMVSDKLETLSKAGLSTENNNFKEANLTCERQHAEPSSSSSTQKTMNDFFPAVSSQSQTTSQSMHGNIQSKENLNSNNNVVKKNLPPSTTTSDPLENSLDVFDDKDDELFLQCDDVVDYATTKPKNQTKTHESKPQNQNSGLNCDASMDEDSLMDEFLADCSFFDRVCMNTGNSTGTRKDDSSPKKSKYN